MAAGTMTMTERDAYRRLQRAHIETVSEVESLRAWNKSLQTQTARQGGRLDALIVSEMYWKQCALDLTEANERYRRQAGEWRKPEVA